MTLEHRFHCLFCPYVTDTKTQINEHYNSAHKIDEHDMRRELY